MRAPALTSICNEYVDLRETEKERERIVFLCYFENNAIFDGVLYGNVHICNAIVIYVKSIVV